RDPGGECRQRLDLHLVFPPPRAESQPVARAEHARVAPQLLEPDPPLPGVEPAPVERPPARRLAVPVSKRLKPVVAALLPAVVVGFRPAHATPAIRLSRRSANHSRSRSRTGAIRPYTSNACPSGSWRRPSAATSGRLRRALERLAPPAPVVRVISRASSSPTSPAK